MKKGNCIEIACKNVIDNPDWLFCYAYVKGQGELIGQRILHAWNEYGDVVFDLSNGHNAVTRKERYYKIAKIKEKNITRQTSKEVVNLMLKTGRYGGWIK